MKVSEIEAEAKQELEEELNTMSKVILKERLREIASAEKVLAKLKKQYQEALTKDLEELVEDDSCN
jgi:hypothetical protein